MTAFIPFILNVDLMFYHKIIIHQPHQPPFSFNLLASPMKRVFRQFVRSGTSCPWCLLVVRILVAWIVRPLP